MVVPIITSAGQLTADRVRGVVTRGIMWCEAIGNSKSKLNTVIRQPRQQSDAQLKDGFMDAWNQHDANSISRK
jgi:hypothetical protein